MYKMFSSLKVTRFSKPCPICKINEIPNECDNCDSCIGGISKFQNFQNNTKCWKCHRTEIAIGDRHIGGRHCRCWCSDHTSKSNYMFPIKLKDGNLRKQQFSEIPIDERIKLKVEHKKENKLTTTHKCSNIPGLPPIPSLPVSNINMCFVGGVSTGKSTLLNGIFCEQLTQCKIKRTTMVPTIYVENDNNSPNRTSPEHIYATISTKNDEIIRLTEQPSSSSKISNDTYNELVFNVGKLDINIIPDAYVNVYDIPGLNDARTKNTYYDYLDKTFSSFNLVVLLVDIHSGLNTSDELDIVRFITSHTKQEMTKNNNKIYTLVVVNKADDMQLPEDGDGNTLELTGELNEMFQQVHTTIGEEFGRHGLIDHIIGIIPLCAVDAYLYRMVMKHQTKFELTPEQILKIGVNENGKKFSTFKPETQRDKVYAILKDNNFIKTMIKLSGFSKFESILHEFLNGTNKVGNEIRISNIMATIKTFPSLFTNIIEVDLGDCAIHKGITRLVSKYVEHYNLIKVIDPTAYSQHIFQCFTEISDAIAHNVQTINSTTDILEYYDKMKTTILQPYFGGINYTYPTYVKERVVTVGNSITHGPVSINVITEIFNSLHKVGVYDHALLIIKDIIERDYSLNKNLCYKINNKDIHNMLVHLIDLTTISNTNNKIIISQFMRVLLISKYQTSTIKHLHWNAMMLFKKHSELVMSSYLDKYINKDGASTDNMMYIIGIDPNFENSDDSILEMFYIDYELTNHTHNFINKKRNTPK